MLLKVLFFGKHIKLLCICCVFQLAFRCCMHTKAGWKFFWAVFNLFCSFQTFFSVFLLEIKKILFFFFFLENYSRVQDYTLKEYWVVNQQLCAWSIVEMCQSLWNFWLDVMNFVTIIQKPSDIWFIKRIKRLKTAKKCNSTSFWVHAATKSWSNYTTYIFINILLLPVLAQPSTAVLNTFLNWSWTG